MQTSISAGGANIDSSLSLSMSLELAQSVINILLATTKLFKGFAKRKPFSQALQEATIPSTPPFVRQFKY